MSFNLAKKVFVLIFSISFFLIPNLSAHGETYSLNIDDKLYEIEYSFDGDVIAMDIDKETISLLIATENVEDSEFQINLPNELIRAENNEFAVLVNGIEVGYDVIETADSNLIFFVPAFTEEIEIIGTFVVPEFPFGTMIVLGSIIGIFIIFQKSRKFLFR